jgi:hypothetical protein
MDQPWALGRRHFPLILLDLSNKPKHRLIAFLGQDREAACGREIQQLHALLATPAVAKQAFVAAQNTSWNQSCSSAFSRPRRMILLWTSRVEQLP